MAKVIQGNHMVKMRGEGISSCLPRATHTPKNVEGSSSEQAMAGELVFLLVLCHGSGPGDDRDVIRADVDLQVQDVVLQVLDSLAFRCAWQRGERERSET